MFGASGLFGSFLPTVYTRLLHRYGQKITLLSHGAGVLLLTTGALLCIDHRVPLEKEVKRQVAVPTSVDFLKKGSFYFLGVSVFVQALVLNLPAIYLPSFAVDIGSSHTTGAIALSMFNLATASGQVSFGLFADHKNSFYSTLFLSTIISGLSAVLLWSEAKTLTSTIIFAVLYGAASGGYGILRSRFAMEVTGKEDKEQMLMVLGLFTATRGAGNVAGGFFGERLVDENVPVLLTAYGLDKFTPLVVFVGLSMLLAGLLGAMQYLNRGYQNNRESSKIRNPQRHTKERMSGDTV
jgi:MFS family permease